MISSDDFDRVEDLRKKVEGPVCAQFLKSGEPVRPILDNIEEELHVYFGEYCLQTKVIDFLLSYQIQKLLICFELLDQTCSRKNGSLFQDPQAGKAMSRPFKFDQITNMFK